MKFDEIKVDESTDKEFLDSVKSSMEALSTGIDLSALHGINKDQIESLYCTAYDYYMAQDYKKAGTLFALIHPFDPTNSRYLLGQAGCLMARKKFEGAINLYQMAFAIDLMNNPEPLYHAAVCSLKLGNKDDAFALLDVAEVCGHEDNERHMLYRQKCAQLMQMIQLGMKNKAEAESEASASTPEGTSGGTSGSTPDSSQGND